MRQPQSLDFVQYYANQLRATNPGAYAAFIQAFDAYATEITVAVIHAPAESVLNFQGRAANAIGMLKKLRDCAERSEMPKPTP